MIKDNGRPSAGTSPRGVFKSLIPGIVRALGDQGYVTPTPVQTQCIPPLLAGRDVLGTAQTGTGKTAAFSLPILQQLSRRSVQRKPGTPRALILAPTRELAAQIAESVEAYGSYLPVRTVIVFGGVKQNSQVTALKRGVDVLVATPGRLLDLIGQGYINLGSVEMLVLDEVDRMLDMGFINDIRKILGKLPGNRQTMFFSATMAGEMKRLADSMLKNPVEVRIEPEKPTLEAIDQRVFYVSRYDKDDLLVSVLGDPLVSKAIVFTQMKHTANKVASKLAKSGIRGTAIHGNKSQNARTRSLDGFKDNRYNVLVATDVAARGLDVDSITHVINYDLPVEAETYVHRIGRTARAGSQGDAISFCTREDKAYLKEIEKLLGKPVPVFSDHEYHCSAAENGPVIPQSSGGSGRRRQQRVRRSH